MLSHYAVFHLEQLVTRELQEGRKRSCLGMGWAGGYPLFRGRRPSGSRDNEDRLVNYYVMATELLKL